MNNLQCRKAYVRVNLDVDEEGTIIPMEVQIVSFLAMLHQNYLAGSFQNRIHILDPHICDPVNVNFRIQYETLEILVADQL